MSGSHWRRSVVSIGASVLLGLTGCAATDKAPRPIQTWQSRPTGINGSPIANSGNSGGLMSNGGGFQPGVGNPIASSQPMPNNFVVPTNNAVPPNPQMNPQMAVQPSNYQYPAPAMGQPSLLQPQLSNDANPNSNRNTSIGIPTFTGNNPSSFGGPQGSGPSMPSGTVPLPQQQSRYTPTQPQFTAEQMQQFQMFQQMQAQMQMQQIQPQQPTQMQMQPQMQPAPLPQTIRVEPTYAPFQTQDIRVPSIPPAPSIQAAPLTIPPENLPRNSIELPSAAPAMPTPMPAPTPPVAPANFTLRPDTSAPVPKSAPGVGTGGIIIPPGNTSGIPANLPPIRVGAGEPGPRVISPRVGEDPSLEPTIPPAPVMPSGDGFVPGGR